MTLAYATGKNNDILRSSGYTLDYVGSYYSLPLLRK